MERRINKKLSGLILGIFLSGLIIQGIYFIVAYIYPQFWSGKGDFALGLWIGVATAIILAFHMYHAIDRALKMEQDKADAYMKKVYVIRTLVILAVTFLVWDFHLGYVMAAFLGMLCLKFGSFVQKIIHKR